MKCSKCGAEIKTKGLEKNGLCEWCVNDFMNFIENGEDVDIRDEFYSIEEYDRTHYCGQKIK